MYGNVGNQNNLKHGMAQTRFYRIWQGMKLRCLNKNSKNYHLYGGRGISICKRWLKFENFFEDMYGTYRDDLTIDRIKVDGDYKPSNCRWVSMKEQSSNRRNSPPKKLIEKLDRIGITYNVYKMRIRKGWSEKEATTIPKILTPQKGKRHGCKNTKSRLTDRQAVEPAREKARIGRQGQRS